MNIKAKPIVDGKFWIVEENGEKIGGFCDVFFNPLYVSQLSEVIIKLIELEIKGVINVASDS